MSYGPSGVAPTQAPYSEAQSRVGTSNTAPLGFISFLVGVVLGTLYLLDNQWAVGCSFLVGGAALGIFMFILAERAEQRLTRQPHGWMLDRNNIKYGVVLIALGVLLLLIARGMQGEPRSSIMIGSSGVAIAAVGLIWTLASLRY